VSGGSYGYLLWKDPSDWVSGPPPEAQQMADRLAALGYHDAAVAMNGLIIEARVCRARLEAYIYRLSEVMKAVEWLDSGDYGPGDLADAVAKFRDAQP